MPGFVCTAHSPTRTEHVSSLDGTNPFRLTLLHEWTDRTVLVRTLTRRKWDVYAVQFVGSIEY